MNYHYFGESIDIHGGGNDLIFPHHENEIAQSESFTGKPFARYWIHNGMLQLRGEKMSKSIGNIISIDEFLEHHSADSFRYLILNSAYRNPIIFSEEVLAQAERGLTVAIGIPTCKPFSYRCATGSFGRATVSNGNDARRIYRIDG